MSASRGGGAASSVVSPLACGVWSLNEHAVRRREATRHTAYPPASCHGGAAWIARPGHRIHPWLRRDPFPESPEDGPVATDAAPVSPVGALGPCCKGPDLIRLAHSFELRQRRPRREW